jgi:Tfp pilus assembly protein PilF
MSRDVLARVYIEIKEYDNAEKILLDILKISKFDFYAISILISLYTTISKPRKAFSEIDRFLSNDKLRFFGANKGRKHQKLFNNIFFLCKRYKYFDKAKVYFEKYEYLLNDRNLNQYKNNLENKTFNFRQRDVEGRINRIGYDFIIIDNHRYSKKFRFFVETGDRVLFDIDFEGNATNIEAVE